MPATSQLDCPISITAISVASCSKITRDLLKSFGCGMGRSVDSLERRWCHCPRRSPHSIFPPRSPPRGNPRCSTASSVQLPRPTPHPRACSSFGLCLHEPVRHTLPDADEVSQVPCKEL